MIPAAPTVAHDPARTAEALFSQSWAIFRKNWIIALPPLIGGVIGLLLALPFAVAIASAFVDALHGVPHAPALDARAVIAFWCTLAFDGVVALWSYAATYGMADEAWSRGTTSLGDGWNAFRFRGATLVVAWIGLIGVAVAAILLALPTLCVSLIALPLATMYVLPSVVAGGRGGFAAIAESFRLARRALGRSALLALMVYAILYGIGMVGSIGILPLYGAMLGSLMRNQQLAVPAGALVFAGAAYLASILLSLAFTGFVAVLLVGFYRRLIAEGLGAAPPGPT